MKKNATQPRPARPKRRPPAVEGERWEDRMKRWTLVFPKELIEQVKREAKQSGRTHSRVVVDAVRKNLS